MAAANILSASRAGVGSVVVAPAASITTQIVGVGTVAGPPPPPPTARQYAVTVIS